VCLCRAGIARVVAPLVSPPPSVGVCSSHVVCSGACASSWTVHLLPATFLVFSENPSPCCVCRFLSLCASSALTDGYSPAAGLSGVVVLIMSRTTAHKAALCFWLCLFFAQHAFVLYSEALTRCACSSINDRSPFYPSRSSLPPLPARQ